MNNGKYYTESYKEKQNEKVDRLFGKVEEITKICCCCGNEFTFFGRIKTKTVAKKRFCSRSCANNRKEWWDGNLTKYRTIAFRFWEKKCVVCGFDKIVAVHHLDENNKNNNPQNLVPLCINHHEMIHSDEWKEEVIEQVEFAVRMKWGFLGV